MNHTKKMVLVPFQDGGGDPDTYISLAPEEVSDKNTPEKKVNSIRKYAAERQQKLLNIVLKLALNGGYDEDGRIKLGNGNYADIVPLLMHVSSPGRNIKGLDDFVDLLYNAGVTPDLIINVNVRDALVQRMSRRRNTPQQKEQKPRTPLHTRYPSPPRLPLMVPEDDLRFVNSRDKRKRSAGEEVTDKPKLVSNSHLQNDEMEYRENIKRKRDSNEDDDPLKQTPQGKGWDDRDSDLEQDD